MLDDIAKSVEILITRFYIILAIQSYSAVVQVYSRYSFLFPSYHVLILYEVFTHLPYIFLIFWAYRSYMPLGSQPFMDYRPNTLTSYIIGPFLYQFYVSVYCLLIITN